MTRPCADRRHDFVVTMGHEGKGIYCTKCPIRLTPAQVRASHESGNAFLAVLAAAERDWYIGELES